MTCSTCDHARRCTVNLEARLQLTHRHTVCVTGGQFSTIRGTQEGLRSTYGGPPKKNPAIQHRHGEDQRGSLPWQTLGLSGPHA